MAGKSWRSWAAAELGLARWAGLGGPRADCHPVGTLCLRHRPPPRGDPLSRSLLNPQQLATQSSPNEFLRAVFMR